jgi:hypothetical protein
MDASPDVALDTAGNMSPQESSPHARPHQLYDGFSASLPATSGAVNGAGYLVSFASPIAAAARSTSMDPRGVMRVTSSPQKSDTTQQHSGTMASPDIPPSMSAAPDSHTPTKGGLADAHMSRSQHSGTAIAAPLDPTHLTAEFWTGETFSPPAQLTRSPSGVPHDSIQPDLLRQLTVSDVNSNSPLLPSHRVRARPQPAVAATSYSGAYSDPNGTSDSLASPSDASQSVEAGAQSRSHTRVPMAGEQANRPLLSPTDPHPRVGNPELHHSAESAGRSQSDRLVPKPGHKGVPEANAAPIVPPPPGGRPPGAAGAGFRRPPILRPPHDSVMLPCSCQPMNVTVGLIVIRFLPVVAFVGALLGAAIVPAATTDRHVDPVRWSAVTTAWLATLSLAILVGVWFTSYSRALWPHRGRLTYNQVKFLLSHKLPATPGGAGVFALCVFSPLYHAALLFSMGEGVLPAQSMARKVAAGVLWVAVPPTTVDVLQAESATCDGTNARIWSLIAISAAIAVAAAALVTLHGLFPPTSLEKLRTAASKVAYGCAFVVLLPAIFNLLRAVPCTSIDVVAFDATTNSTVVSSQHMTVNCPTAMTCGSGAHIGSIVAAMLVLFAVIGPLAWFLTLRLRTIDAEDEPTTSQHCIKTSLATIGWEVLVVAQLVVCNAFGYGGPISLGVSFALHILAWGLAYRTLPSSTLFATNAWRVGRSIDLVSSVTALIISVCRMVKEPSDRTLRLEVDLTTPDIVMLAVWCLTVLTVTSSTVVRWLRYPRHKFGVFESSNEAISLNGVHFVA